MTTIVHHANCPDGFTAAWLINIAVATERDTPRIVAANYGDEPPAIDYGEHVYIVDFCYEPHQFPPLQQMAGKLVVLDHHQTSRAWMTEVVGEEMLVTNVDDVESPFGTGTRDRDLWVSDMGHSGATLAAWYIGDDGPPFVRFVEDRDLWRWRLSGTAEVFAAVTSRPYTLEAYDELASMHADQLIGEGRAINRYREQLIEQTLATAFQMPVLGHDDIWVAASPYAIGSDVAARLAAERDPDRFAGYFVDYGDRWRFGLRSLDCGLNVAEIAGKAGGGGHPHAAGFEVTRDGSDQ